MTGTPFGSADYVPFHRASICDDDIESVSKVLRSGWLTTGCVAEEFERQFAAYVGSAHAVAVNSCTAALHLALVSAGIEPGDEVIVPTMTFASTAEVVTYLAAKPVLADSEALTGNVDIACVERACTSRTRAIIAVHFGGHAADLESLRAFCRLRDITLIEDAAHALPAEYHGERIGARSEFACFSFYATKTITCGEGGMVVTTSPEHAERLRRLSLHGLNRDAWKRYAKGGSWRYDIVEAGYKYNLTDIAAALGVSQLARCDAFLDARASIAAKYSAAFQAISSIETPPVLPYVGHAWHLYAIRIRPERWTISRDELVSTLHEAGIGVSVHFIPLHHHSFYKSTYGVRYEDFPVANDLFERSISLPIFPSMTEDQITRVIDTVLTLSRKFSH